MGELLCGGLWPLCEGLELGGSSVDTELDHRDRSKPRERILKKLRDKVAVWSQLCLNPCITFHYLTTQTNNYFKWLWNILKSQGEKIFLPFGYSQTIINIKFHNASLHPWEILDLEFIFKFKFKWANIINKERNN